MGKKELEQEITRLEKGMTMMMITSILLLPFGVGFIMLLYLLFRNRKINKLKEQLIINY